MTQPESAVASLESPFLFFEQCFAFLITSSCVENHTADIHLGIAALSSVAEYRVNSVFTQQTSSDKLIIKVWDLQCQRVTHSVQKA